MKQTYMCEGCEVSYSSKEFAEECERIHNVKIESMSVINVKFVSHRPEIKSIRIQYDKIIAGTNHTEKVWFHVK